MMKKPQHTARRHAWSYKAGEKGRNRVRVFAWPEQGESLWIEYREGGRKVRKLLGHADKDRAKREADDIAGRWGQETKARPAVLTLRTLFDIYEREVTPQKGKSGRGHDERTLPLFVKAFGGDRRPETLNVRDWQSYIRRRQSGELAPDNRRKKPRKTGPKTVRPRVIEQNLKLLLAVLNWAERAQHPDGSGYLIDKNPLRGLRLPKEENPRQPMFTPEQCIELRTAAQEHRSSLAERFVMLAWYTGHRSNAIRQLHWSDIDLEAGTIRWRADADKIGYEHRNPLHPELLSFLKQDRARVKAIGEAFVFPAPCDSSKPLPRDTVQKLWNVVAKATSIPRGQGYGWHSFRRAFANALRNVPLRELKDLGGWKSEKTLITVYLQPDEAAQRIALDKLVATSNGQ